MLRALIIRKPWIDMILDGHKTLELRGSRTSVRGTIALIEGGSGTVKGVCDLCDCIGPLTNKTFLAKEKWKSGTPPDEGVPERYGDRCHAWVLRKRKRLVKPVPYNHPSGAVICVILDAKVEKAIRKQL